jgi:hypothetical protein
MHAMGRTNTGPATLAQLARYSKQVDPDGILEPAERARRAEYALKSHMTFLALAASRARRKKTTLSVSETPERVDGGRRGDVDAHTAA